MKDSEDKGRASINPDELAASQRIESALQQATSELGRPLTEYEKAYHRLFWQAAITEWGKNAGLVYDDPKQLDYPYDHNSADFMLDFGPSLAEDWGAFAGAIEPKLTELLPQLKKQSIIIPVAHASGMADVPAITCALQVLLRQMGATEYSDNIYQVLGPRVTTVEINKMNLHKVVLQGLSNLLKTVPSKNELPGFEDELRGQRLRFVDRFHTLAGEPGNILVVAIAGQRGQLSEDQSHYMIADTTESSLKLLAQPKALVWPIGMVEHLLKNGRLQQSPLETFPGEFMHYDPGQDPVEFGREVMGSFDGISKGRIRYLANKIK